MRRENAELVACCAYQQKIFTALADVCKSRSIQGSMKARSLLICSRMWLQTTFGGAEAGMELPLCMTLSTRPKYSKFFLEANKTLSLHLKRACFEAIGTSWSRVTKLRTAKHFRLKHHIFLRMKQKSQVKLMKRVIIKKSEQCRHTIQK